MQPLGFLLSSQAAGLLGQLAQAGSLGSKSSAQPVSGSSGLSAQADLLARYDLRQITPREFSQLIEQLHQRGLISREERELLWQLRLQLDAQGVGADEPLDLVQWLKDQLRQAVRKQTSPWEDHPQLAQRVQQLQAQLSWVQKFQLLRQQSSQLTSWLA